MHFDDFYQKKKKHSNTNINNTSNSLIDLSLQEGVT